MNPPVGSNRNHVKEFRTASFSSRFAGEIHRDGVIRKSYSTVVVDSCSVGEIELPSVVVHERVVSGGGSIRHGLTYPVSTR